MKKRLIIFLCIVMAFAASACGSDGPAKNGGNEPPEPVEVSMSKTIRLVDEMPDMPESYTYTDFADWALRLDALLFDFARTPGYVEPSYGTLAPIGFWQLNAKYGDRSFGLPSYLGHVDGAGSGTMRPGATEGIASMNAVWGATLAGADKSAQQFTGGGGEAYTYDFVSMLKQYYDPVSGLVLNRESTSTGGSFWYELFPLVQFSRIANLYPGLRDVEKDGISLREIVLTGAAKWLGAAGALSASGTYRYTAYNFSTNTPVTGIWTEPPCGGLAYIFYNAFMLSGDMAYINNGVIPVLDWLSERNFNPNYEVLADYLPYIAAVMNFRFNKNYDVGKMLDYIFEADSDVRAGSGVVNGMFGDHPAYGLMGYENSGNYGKSTYAFAMNTFHLATVLAPMLNYDSRFADSVGKWFMHAVNSSRLFFGGLFPETNQSCPAYDADPGQLIAYEGVRAESKNAVVSPYLMGDPTVTGWGKTDYGIYGGSAVGMLGGLVKDTNVPRILQVDVGKADDFAAEGDKTYLYYNPYSEEKSVELVLDGDTDIFDTVSNSMLFEGAGGTVNIVIPAKKALVLKLLPAGSEPVWQRSGGGVNAGNIGYIMLDGKKLASFGRPALTLLNDLPNRSAMMEDRTFRFKADIQEGDSISVFTVAADGVTLYEGAYEDSYTVTMDALKAAGIDGDTEFTFKIASEKWNCYDTCSERLCVIDTRGKEKIFGADKNGLGDGSVWNYQSMSAAVNADSCRLSRTSAGDNCAATTKSGYRIDLGKRPFIAVNIKACNYSYTIQLSAGGNTYYLAANEHINGTLFVDIPMALFQFAPHVKMSGEIEVRFRFLANGAGSKAVPYADVISYDVWQDE